jgi:hypothetical protein
MTTTTAAPCRRCQTTGGAIDKRNGRPTRRRRMCAACYRYEDYHGHIAQYTTTSGDPTPDNLPTGVVTPSMLGITPGEIEERRLAAEVLLTDAVADGLTSGWLWGRRHPEQFGTANLRRIFGDDLAASFWAGSATAERAA